MEEIEEFLAFRKELLNDSKDEDGFIQESELLIRTTPSILDAKLVDTEESNPAYHYSESDNNKINAYTISDSGERLQLYIVDERTLIENKNEEALKISLRGDYEKQFSRASSLIKNILNLKTGSEVQDSSPILPLISKLTSEDGIDQFDVIDIFLVSLTATVERPGGVIRPRTMHFEEKTLNVSAKINGKKINKDILLMRKVIDLNFLYNVEIAKGNREPLVINFEKTFGEGIEAIQAANEKTFESYLCVFPAKLIAELYKRHSTRLLEKNVRSFLQFGNKSVNSGMKATISNPKESYKFIAYNNGLTITATAGKIKKGKGQTYIKSLTDFQIVNGGQTSATLYFCQKEGLDISKVRVMAKVNIAKDLKDQDLNDLIGKISQFSNAQSKVSKVDLRSRNPQLVKLKQLSQSVMTPKGEQWFFERAKGEYQTQVRLKGRNKKAVTKKYPPKRRFSKELLAKYYSSWGDRPYLVKMGGEKIFRYFIEELSGNTDDGIEPLNVDRDLYENMICRILIFRGMETIHGARAKALGQLRAAVIPYSISILYSHTEGLDEQREFDFRSIWKLQALPSDLSDFLEDLMKVMYIAIKKYSASDDLSEYSKKQELWESVKSCTEISKFIATDSSKRLLDRYTIRKK